MAISTPSASPAVTVREIDLTGVAPNVQTSTGAIVGNFRWGPVNKRVLISGETELVETFASPTENNAVDFLSAAYFLKYSNSLYVVRGANDNAGVAAMNATSGAAGLYIENEDKFDQGTWSETVIARYPGKLGNSIGVSVWGAGQTQFEFSEYFENAPGTSPWLEAFAPLATNDEAHVVVYDVDGGITGTPGTVLETFAYVSLMKNAITLDGSPNYIASVVNKGSKWVYITTASGLFGSVNPVTSVAPNHTGPVVALSGAATSITLAHGNDSDDLFPSSILDGYQLFADKEVVEVDFLITPQCAASYYPGVIAGYDSDNTPVYSENPQPFTSSETLKTIVEGLVAIAHDRKDCVVVTSPDRESVVGSSAGVEKVTAAFSSVTRSSYLVVDNNFFKVYDKYNDKYVMIPAASSTAGLMASTDLVAAPWFSPAGQRRGQYLGVTDIIANPNKTQRDTLYKAGINPIANIPGAGVVLYGDKTFESRPSAFDRINVRRLFLAVERSIAIAARNVMFEFNDEFTRAEFVNIVEPLLREIQGRRGITDFRVVCDETNNTPAVVDRNEFVASIFIKPARSINFVTLNFVAVRTGVEFDEVVGIV